METNTDTPPEVEEKTLEEVTVRFAGDSGDGMQLTGSQFTKTTALVGNDLETFPDYPAEIRAPAGTLFGVSGFQISFASHDVYTPGDRPDVLVAMNPAALKVNLEMLRPGGIIIANADGFDAKNLRLAGYESNPLEDGSLKGYEVYSIPITKLTTKALEELPLSMKEIVRSKNFFALGLMYWLFNRPLEPSLEWIEKKFAKHPDLMKANSIALKAGYNYGDITHIFTTRYRVEPAKLPAGKYRNITGNEAMALGIVASCELSGLPGFLGSYPITPASDILHELSRYRRFNFRTFQAEDEIAGITSAIGASFAGSLAFTTSSGPGIALKQEAIGLAVMVELPLVIINVQRGGPSTGLPTKTEQADLFQAIIGRNGEAPVVVLAATTPGDCFHSVIEASRIAVKYMTPVMLLSDGYIANGSEPWLIPDPDSLEKIPVKFATNPDTFQPYSRDKFNSRPWAIPGTPGLEHRIGGLEKKHITGNVSYDPVNHEFMCRLRREKIEGIADELPNQEVYGPESGDVLIVGWGGTYGALRQATEHLIEEGKAVGHAHIKYLYPFPRNLRDVLSRYKTILVPELNLGQLSVLLKAQYLIPVESYNKIQGLPFTTTEIMEKVNKLLEGK